MRMNMVALLGVCAVAGGCSGVEDRSDFGAEFSEVYSKQLEVRSADGESWALLTLSSPDAEALDSYDATTIGFVPTRAGDWPLAEIADDEAAVPADDGELTPDQVIAVEVAEVHLQPGFDGYAVDMGDGIELAPKGINEIIFITTDDCIAVTRIRRVSRVWVSMYAQPEPSSEWITLVYDYLLAYGETIDRCYAGSEMMRVDVTSRRRNAFTVSFHN